MDSTIEMTAIVFGVDGYTDAEDNEGQSHYFYLFDLLNYHWINS